MIKESGVAGMKWGIRTSAEIHSIASRAKMKYDKAKTLGGQMALRGVFTAGFAKTVHNNKAAAANMQRKMRAIQRSLPSTNPFRSPVKYGRKG